MKHTIIGVGEILWDIFPTGKQLGGAPANVIYHVHAQGANGICISAVGTDTLGNEIIERLRTMGLSIDFITADPNRPTGSVTVQVGDGIPMYTIHENVAWDYIPFSEKIRSVAQHADAVCFGSLAQRSPTSRETIRKILSNTKENALRVFDCNLRSPFYTSEYIHESLLLASVLKLSDEELPILAEMFGFQGSEEKILEQMAYHYSLHCIALTKRSGGSLLYSEGKWSQHSGVATKVVDTVGAGDSFTAMFMLGILRGDDLDRINHLANTVASHVCSHSGATPAMPLLMK